MADQIVPGPGFQIMGFPGSWNVVQQCGWAPGDLRGDREGSSYQQQIGRSTHLLHLAED